MSARRSWVERLSDQEVEEIEREVSRATVAMPDLLRALLADEIGRAYWMLRDYAERNELSRGFAGCAILSLRKGGLRGAAAA